MLGRALHGVATPTFYKGEQVGERRRYDERLAMFLLRARAPDRYGKWRDQAVANLQHPDGAAIGLGRALRALAEDGVADQAGRARPRRAPLRPELLADDPAEREAADERRERAEVAAFRARRDAYFDTLGRQTGQASPEDDFDDDVAGIS